MIVNGALIFNLIASIIFIVIIFLIGQWFIRYMGLGEPWPKILMLLVVLLAMGVIWRLFFGGGAFIRVSGLDLYLSACALV